MKINEKKFIILTVVAIAIAFIGIAILFMSTTVRTPSKSNQVIAEVLEINKTLPWIEVQTNAVKNGRILKNFTCDGGGQEPIIKWKMYDNANCYAVIVFDPDAPMGTFYHLIELVKINGNEINVVKVYPNSAGYEGWFPVCPPKGETHRYFFVVVALKKCEIHKNFNELIKYIDTNAVALGYEMGTYTRR
ncbi:hypothetical protein IPA_00135 [Ignicoccus pacificus DSM 13166]|uniref:YbhB/YbcL family Raf kinase inhibitor-like protein n=1 Tax=Ignicoccus pacificus DSM 13166 TaxID=940294 RepID=A0A977K8U1_9CREN|nr:hypothetical protein IPA_00135 [Ignicoccus pacificus DSM 13166]